MFRDREEDDWKAIVVEKDVDFVHVKDVGIRRQECATPSQGFLSKIVPLFRMSIYTPDSCIMSMCNA